MICKRVLPGPELRNYIREYLTIHLVFENTEVSPPAKAYPVHSGTRGLGANVANHYTRIAKEKRKLPSEVANWPG